jgi:methyl-accepting chemotaxis protein
LAEYSIATRLRLAFAIITLAIVVPAAIAVVNLPSPANWWAGAAAMTTIGVALWLMVWLTAGMRAEGARLDRLLSGLAAGRLDVPSSLNVAHEFAAAHAAAQSLRPLLAAASRTGAAIEAITVPVLGHDGAAFAANPAARDLGGDIAALGAACLGTPNGEIAFAGRTLAVRAIAAATEAGEAAGTVFVLHDLTPSRRLVAELTAAAQQAGRGDFTHRLEAEGRDETGSAVAKAFNRMLDGVSDACTEFAGQLESMATGDLTRRIDKMYDGVFNRLKGDYNGTVVKLSTIMRSVDKTAGTLSGIATEIASSAAELSDRSEKHAASMEETAAAVEELTATVRQNSTNAQQANVLADQARHTASGSGQVVTDAIAAMGRIEESALKIGAIVGMIDEIAFQTNLLALNAAVEAARAGDAGKGFAVVAQEVRNLAQRSAQASREIKVLIAESGREVANGASLVKDAGSALERITLSVQQVAAIVEEIAAATKEQNVGIGQVSSTITEIDEATQRNAALVEESAATANALEQEAEALKGQMAFFLVDAAQAGGLARHAALVLGTKIDHLTFRQNVLDTLAGKNNLTADKLADHHGCRLGKWYDGIEEKRVKNSGSYALLLDPHKRVHEAGKRALACHAAGDRHGSDRAMADLQAASVEVLGLLDALAKELRQA